MLRILFKFAPPQRGRASLTRLGQEVLQGLRFGHRSLRGILIEFRALLLLNQGEIFRVLLISAHLIVCPRLRHLLLFLPHRERIRDIPRPVPAHQGLINPGAHPAEQVEFRSSVGEARLARLRQQILQGPQFTFIVIQIVPLDPILFRIIPLIANWHLRRSHLPRNGIDLKMQTHELRQLRQERGRLENEPLAHHLELIRKHVLRLKEGLVMMKRSLVFENEES